MGIEQTYNFDNASNFTLSQTQISNNVAKLALTDNPNQNFSQDFTSDTGFTYDSDKAEFSGGMVQQVDQRPADSTIFMTWDRSLDINWQNQSASGSTSLLNSSNATLDTAGSRLALLNQNSSAIYSAASGNANYPQVGAFEARVAFNFNTVSPSTQVIAAIGNGSNTQSRMQLFLRNTGELNLEFQDSTGTQSNNTLGNFAPVEGQVYVFEVNYDFNSGATRVFIDGNQIGSTLTDTITRNAADMQNIYFGRATNTGSTGNFYLYSFTYFDAVQHTSNYTAASEPGSYPYVESEVELPPFTYSGIGTIQAVESSTITESGFPRFTVAGRYWDGSSWAVSDGSYSQANPSSVTIDNLDQLSVEGAVNVPVSIIFPNAETTSSVDLVSVTVTGQKYFASGYVEPSQALQVEDVIAYSENVTVPTNTNVGRLLKVDGNLKYFVSGSLVDSDGSFAQSNNESDFSSALVAYNFQTNTELYPRWVLTTSDDNATAELSDATIEYDFGATEPVNETCLVYGYLKKIDNTAAAGVTIQVGLESDREFYKKINGASISNEAVSTTTDANGYFELTLLRTSEFSKEIRYALSIVDDSFTTDKLKINRKVLFKVPDAETKDITSLL